MTTSPPKRYFGPGVYILLALLLMFGSEILVWTNPPGRPLLQWLLLIPGYLALSAVLLDFTVRYRVRDVFGALLLTGVYSLGERARPQSGIHTQRSATNLGHAGDGRTCPDCRRDDRGVSGFNGQQATNTA